MGTIIHVIFYQPIFNILILLYDLFGGNLGLAIIAIAAIAKLVTIPITKKQLKSAEEMKVFQQKQKEIKKKFGKNKEKMNEELMKLSSKYMPAQLGGCLPLIISIILLIQVRGVVINLVNEGFHAFNEVAYVQSIKKQEDSIFFKIEEDLEKGEHELKLQVEATNGNKIEKTYKFEIVEDVEGRVDEIKASELEKSEEERFEEKEAIQENYKTERKSDISIFNKTLEDKESEALHSIVLKRFLLFFPSESITAYLLEDDTPEFEIYMRAPSDEWISNVEIFFNGNDVTEKAQINRGEKLNLNFWGMDLSKVGSEFFGNWTAFIPYLIISILLGLTQFVVSKIQMGVGSMDEEQTNKKKEESKKKKKKKKDEPEEPDFSEMMQQSSKQMIYFMPIFSVLMALGYVGGANIFPTAVSVFWTAQNGFVIIQLGITKRKELVELFNNRFKLNIAAKKK